MSITDMVTFARAVARDPRSVGAIAPSSRGLAERLAMVVPTQHRSHVLELGSGNGCVTEALAARVHAGSVLVAIERDPALCSTSVSRVPTATVLCGSATDLGALLPSGLSGTFDAVVCGLPWANFDRRLQLSLLEDIVESISPSGVFTTFAYVHALTLPAAKRFRELLDRHFDEVMVTSAVLWNAPPAVTYVCRRPISVTARRRPERGHLDRVPHIVGARRQ